MCYMASITATTNGPDRRDSNDGANQQSGAAARVGVRELRQNLSIYLDRVKQGESLTVNEHGQVVAMLSPLARALSPVDRLIAEGRARPASRPLTEVRPRHQATPADSSSEEVISDMRVDRL